MACLWLCALTFTSVPVELGSWGPVGSGDNGRIKQDVTWGGGSWLPGKGLWPRAYPLPSPGCQVAGVRQPLEGEPRGRAPPLPSAPTRGLGVSGSGGWRGFRAGAEGPRSDGVPRNHPDCLFFRAGCWRPPTIFGNGRTHTGKVMGPGGSRLANYGVSAELPKKGLHRLEPAGHQEGGDSGPQSTRQWQRAGAAGSGL